MKYFRNLKIILPVIITLLVGSVVSLYYFGINVGTDYDPGMVVTMSLGDEMSVKEVESKLKETLDDYERLEQVGSRYELYFINSEANITSDDLKLELEQSLGELFESDGEIVAKEYRPTSIYYVNEKLLEGGLVLTSVFAIFTLILYKNNNLKYDEILALLLSDYLFVIFELVVLFGGISVVGQLNIFLSARFVIAIFFIMFIALSIKIFANLRFDDFLESHRNINIDKTWKAYIDRDWPTIIFILALLIILVITPMSVLGVIYIPVITSLILVLVVAFLSEITLKQNFLKILLAAFRKAPGLKLLQNKKW